ncbi:DNA polymerase I [Methylogaea oryzae]|uniref:DNA polymerase I n=1 Tax=Methylogaea oryzae TaxID=1295382 RepID=A0A8D4VRK1_9GAMM|nr:DNA polymerase I [Methylogaea oryzae]BBL72830.1 DNA polymerase I [Methylogaea oryzae]
MADPAPLLVLVDGSSFLYRAFHALPPLTNSHGEPTGAVFGVANMLRKLEADYQTPHVAVVFDAPGKTFRNEAYEQYKAHRPPMPDELKAQIEPLHRLVKAMGLPLLMETGVEADDVIGTLAVRAAAAGYKVVVSTGDKDMAQLVNDAISLENTMTNTRMDRQGVMDKFGVAPEQIVDYLTLVGDTSDNIPGVPKVGPKTAAKWLQEYGSLDNLIAHADAVGGKVGENLRASLEQIPLSKHLATIHCDVELPLGPDELKRGEPDVEALRELLARLEFFNWLKQVEAGGGQSNSPHPSGSAPLASLSPEGEGTGGAQYETVLTESQLDAWLAKLEQAELFAFDTETTSLDYMSAEIVGVSFAVTPGEAAYVPLAHHYLDAPQQLDRDAVLARLKPLLEDENKAKLGQHLKYDGHVLANHGIALAGIRHDTMLESYVLDSTATRHDMDSLARHYLGVHTIHYEDVAGKGAKQIPFSQVAVEAASDYAAEDADITLKLHQTLWPKLEAEPALRAVYEEIEIPLVPVLGRMEHLGVLIDTAKLARQSQELADRLYAIEEQAFEVAGERFNLASPKQIQTILYDKLQIPVTKKTPKGQPSTAEEVLQDLAYLYELPRLLLEHRSLNKLKSTYTDNLPKQVCRKTGRVHTSYHQAVAATGRLSSSDPNLQNIPVRTEEGRKIRQAFVAPPGHVILAADYSQIELRIMAHLSGDKGLLDAFAHGDDIHRATAAEVFGLAPDSVSSEQRRSAKAINFGLIYGMSAFGLAKQLGVGQKEAQRYIELYFARYPGVKAYMDDTRAAAKERGYVETVFGRRLYVPDINARDGQRRQYAERTAINAPMQGTAADIIKRAMLAVDGWIQQSGAPLRMIMQVHDELVFEVAEGYVEQAKTEIAERMGRAAELHVPLVVDVGVGSNWDEAH